VEKNSKPKLNDRQETNTEFEGIVGLIDKIVASVKGISPVSDLKCWMNLGFFEALRTHAGNLNDEMRSSAKRTARK